MKKENFLNLVLMVIIGVLVVVGTVQAATTISTNIVTEGTLSVTGTSTLTGYVGMGSMGATSTLALFGPIRQYAGYGAHIVQPSGYVGNQIIMTASSTLDYSRTPRFTNGVLIGGTIGNPSGSYGDDQASVVIGGSSYGGPGSYFNVIMGFEANTAIDSSYNTLIGKGATLVTSAVSTCCGTSIGADSKVAKFGSALGNNAWANATSSIAIGYNAKVSGANSAAFGPVTVSGQNIYSYGGAAISHGFGTTTPFSKFHVTSGASATTTVNFGEVGVASSKACFNTKNTAGSDISFYFVGTTMVVENRLCL